MSDDKAEHEDGALQALRDELAARGYETAITARPDRDGRPPDLTVDALFEIDGEVWAVDHCLLSRPAVLPAAMSAAERAFDNYRVALTARDELVTRIDNEVLSCGLTVTGSTSANQIGAVHAVMAVGAKRDGLLPKVLNTLADAWTKDRTTWDNMAIRAVGMVIDTNWDTVQLDRLSRTLQKAPVGHWKMHAVRMTTSGGGSNSRSLPLAENIVTAYNSGLRDRKLLVSPARATEVTEEYE